MKTNRLYKWAITGLIGLSACGNSNPDHIPNYTSGNKADTTHVSGGIVMTTRGKEIFEQRCIACHGPNGNYKNNNAANLQISKIDSISIINTIKNGKNPMPMFGSVIPDSDLAQVEMYVKTLRK